jgi:hypothetical protein
VIELNSTAADGVTWLVYTLVCYCDVPQLQTAADSPTITGANVSHDAIILSLYALRS